MANLALIDLNVAGEAFDAAYVEMLRFKRDRNGTRPSSDAWRKAIAEWANFQDDCARALQRWTRDLETRVASLEADPGVTDHGALTGLADNDHPQYALTASAARVLDRQNTTTEITDGSLATLYTYAVPADTLSAGSRLVIEIDWDALNNSGQSRNANWSIAFGGTTMWTNTAVAFGVNNTRRPGTFRFSIYVRSAAELVFRGDISHVSTTATSVTAGYGASGSNRSLDMQIGADMFAAVLSNPLTFSIAHTWSANVANLSIRKLAAVAWLL